MSEAAKKRYIIPSTKRLNEKKLKSDSAMLPPRHRNWKAFKESFGNKNNYLKQDVLSEIHASLPSGVKGGVGKPTPINFHTFVKRN